MSRQRTVRRRQGRRRRGQRPPNQGWVLSRPIGFPNTMKTQSSASFRFTFTGINPVEPFAFVANGFFDPYPAGTDTFQPQYFAELMAIYSRYEVVSAHFRVQYVNEDNDDGAFLVMYPSFTSTTINDWQLAAQQPYANLKLIGRGNSLSLANMFKAINIQQFVGRTTASINYTGTILTNPTNPVYMQILMSGNTSVPLAGNFSVMVTYNVKFFRRTTILDVPSVSQQLKTEVKTDVPDMEDIGQSVASRHFVFGAK